MNGNFPTPLPHRALYMVKVLLAQFQVFSMLTALSEMLTALSERLTVKVLLEQFQVLSMVTALSEMLTALSERLAALSGQVTALA